MKKAKVAYARSAPEAINLAKRAYGSATFTGNPVVQVKSLNLLAEFYIGTLQYDSAGSVSNHALMLAAKNHIDSLKGDSWVNLAIIDYRHADYDQAVKLYLKAALVYGQTHQPYYVGISYFDVALCYIKISKYPEAVKFYFLAAHEFETLKDLNNLANCYNGIGLSLAAVKNYPKAIWYHLTALHIRQQLKDELAVRQSLNNLGFTYRSSDRVDSAIYYFKKCIQVNDQNKAGKALVLPLQNLGAALKTKGDLVGAERFIRRSLQLAVIYQMDEQFARGNLDLAEVYAAQRKFRQAFAAINLTQITSAKLQLPELLMNAFAAKSEVYQRTGNPKAALAYYRKENQLKDSLFNITKDQAVNELEIRYKSRERERDIADLHTRDRISQKMLGEQRFSIMVLIISAILLLALLSLAFYSFRAQRKAHLLVKELMKEVNHRTKNNLQILSSLLILQIENQDNESVKQALQETEVRLHTMNIMYSKLYTGQANTTVDMAEYLSSLLTHIQDGFSHEKRPVELVKDLDQISLPTDKAVLLGLVLNELSSNAMRHAASARGLILTVSLKRKNGHEAQLSIQDNGKLKKKIQKTTENSFGLRIVSLITGQLEAVMETEAGNPYAYLITFPI